MGLVNPDTNPTSNPNLLRVRVFQGDDLTYHYQAYPLSKEGGKLLPTLCGLPVTFLSPRAWFAVGDPRGKGYFERGCGDCRDGLRV